MGAVTDGPVGAGQQKACRALILDCDGVLAETERDGHRVAFNRAFVELGVPLRWSTEGYRDALRIGGGKERIAASLSPEALSAAASGGDPDAFVQRVHARKSAIFEEILEAGDLVARPGVRRLLVEADAAGWRLAVASTSAERSVRAVLRLVAGAGLAERIPVFAGDVVPAKKPDPAIYRLALERLGVDPRLAVAVEDSRNGLLAACGAGLRCVVTVSAYADGEAFDEAALVVSGLGDPGEPLTVLENRSGCVPGPMLTLADLDRIVS